MEDEIIDVSDKFKGCIAAEMRGLNVLILRRLKEPFQRFDGKVAMYELEYRWLSRPDVCCVLGNEFTYYQGQEIRGWEKKNLFNAFQLC
jgi:hypothetical protein